MCIRDRLQALREALAQDRPERPVGLGLVLAQLVARAHGGTLRLPEATAGFVVELDLGVPTDSEPDSHPGTHDAISPP